MKTSNAKLMSILKTGVCALAFASLVLSPRIAYAANDNPVAEKANTQIEQNAQDQTAEKRKQIVSEAVTALNETRGALKSLDEGKTSDALSALERATGKLELILAREPTLALAPTGVGAVTYDVYGTPDAVKKASKTAEDLLEDGNVQGARQILKFLASETVVSVTNIPLATYPAAIKRAVSLIDDGKPEEAKKVLQTALNTLVITESIIPIPVVTAQNLLKEAETLAEKKDRSLDESKRLNDLLTISRQEIEMAQALGYGTEEDFDDFYKELSLIEEKTSDGKSGAGFFEKIKSSMTAMFDDSQPAAYENETINN
jgi:hypothetical protein